MLEGRSSLRVADPSAAALPVYVTLGVACLCLRLTMITTSITAQKVAGDDDDRLPLLLRLAKGTVTARAGEELAGILTALPDDPGLRNHWGGGPRETACHDGSIESAIFAVPGVSWQVGSHVSKIQQSWPS